MIVDVQWQRFLERAKGGGDDGIAETELLLSKTAIVPEKDPQLGLPNSEYEFVCLKCWHGVGNLAERIESSLDTSTDRVIDI